MRDDEKTPFGVPNKSVTLSKMVILEEQCSTSCAAFLEGKHKILNKFSYENWFFWICQKKYKRFFGKSAVNQWIDYFDFADKKIAVFGHSPVCKKWRIFFVVMSSSWIVPHLTYILLIVSSAGRFKKRPDDRFSKRERPRPDRPPIVPEIQGRWRDDRNSIVGGPGKV